MAIYIGDNAVKKVYLGATEIKKVYKGSTLIYSAIPPPEFDYLAPSDLVASTISTTEIGLTWVNNSVNAEGNSIERREEATAFAEIDTVLPDEEAYLDDTCIEGTKYYYRLRAFKGAEYSDYSNIDSVETESGAEVPDGSPSLLTAVAFSNTRIDLEWLIGSTNHDGHAIERTSIKGGGSGWAEIDRVLGATNTYQNSELTGANHFWYRARAFKGAEYSVYSNIAVNAIPLVLYSANIVGRYEPLATGGALRNGEGIESVYWDLTVPLGTLGAEQSSGVIVKYAVYKITACTNDFFYVGCTIGDTFVCEVVKTCSSTNKVKRYTGNHLAEGLVAKCPINQVLDGTDDVMKTAPFTWSQPEFIFMVAKQITWTSGDYLFDGNAANTARLYQITSTPGIVLYAGGEYSALNKNLPLNTFAIIRVVFNGDISKLQINNTSAIMSNFGAGNAGAFTLGARASTVLSYCNMQNKEIILGNSALSSSDEEALYNYLAVKHGFPAINIPIRNKYGAGICLSFDDPQTATYLDSWVTADAVLQAYGWKATFAVSTSPGNTPEQDVAEVETFRVRLQGLIAGGHELANHGIRHYGLNTWLAVPKTRQEYYDDIIAPMNTILQNAFGPIPKVFAYPNWYGSDEVMSDIIINNGFSYVRQNLATYPAGNMGGSCYDGSNQRVLGFDIAPYSGATFTDAQIVTLLDYARNNNFVLKLFSHKIITEGVPGPYEVHIDRLKMICQYIIDNNMTFYKMSELKPEIFIA